MGAQVQIVAAVLKWFFSSSVCAIVAGVLLGNFLVLWVQWRLRR